MKNNERKLLWGLLITVIVVLIVLGALQFLKEDEPGTYQRTDGQTGQTETIKQLEPGKKPS